MSNVILTTTRPATSATGTALATPALATPALRVRAENPNHHLWNNHGTWFLHYTVHPTPFTKERIRRSLGTKDLTLARERRDTYFAHLSARTTDPGGLFRATVAA